MNHLVNPHYLGARTIDLISADSEKLSDTHFKWHMSNKIIAPANTHLIIGLLSANIPYSWYSVRSTNNTFTINTTVSAVDYSVNFTIPEGNYTGQTYANAINTLFTTEKSNLGLTSLGLSLNRQKNKYYISCSPSAASFEITNATNYKEIGLTSATGQTETSTSSFYMDKSYDLSGDKSVFVRMHSKGLRNINTKNISNILANIPIVSAPHTTLYYMPHVVEYYKIDDDLTTIEIEMLDEDLNTIDTINVSNSFRFTLSVHFSYNKHKMIDYNDGFDNNDNI